MIYNQSDDVVLSKVATYINEKMDSLLLNNSNYVSTENMLPNKGGLVRAESIPSGKVNRFLKNDILISNIRPYFKKIWYADKNGGCSADVLIVRSNSEIYSRYLYYVLMDDFFFEYSMKGSKGTKMPRGDKGHIMNYPMRVPSYKTQEAIANILSSLDDKIELNNKINKNLEELAQTLYKQWFVDFEFPNEDGEPYKSSGGEMVESELGLIPKGWIIENITNLFVFKGGSQPPKEEHIYEHREGYVRFIQNRDYKEETRHLTFIKESPRNKTAEKLDILMDKYGEVGQIRYGIEGAYNVALAKIDPINSKNLELLRGYFSQDSIREYLSNSSIASTRGSLNATTFTGLKIAYTESEIKEAYSGFQTNILLKILKNKEENKRLSQIRDELLPKLMNGEIEVPIEE